jgi:hypothetical protein
MLKLYDRNARTHSKKQIHQIATSIQRFGLTNPIDMGSVFQRVVGGAITVREGERTRRMSKGEAMLRNC